jgi:putative flippase GtrA
MAHSLSYLTGAICSFLLNRHWTFDAGAPGSALRQARSFALASLAGLLFGAAIVWVVSLWCSPVLAKVIATGATFVLNYALCRFFVFAKPIR